MNSFDPGPGWRRTTPEETEWPRAIARIEYFEDGREIGWVREASQETPPDRWAEGFAAGLHACAAIDEKLRNSIIFIVDEMTESADSELWPYAERLRVVLKRGVA